ncbi:MULTISPECIES: hypothetical protein [Vibrio]|uniref:hypothetical protein n=1 Tax=Vibrio TaxID=662 RepID=UPI000B5C8199|nr:MULTISPECIES: hypothetical protein [Vibrio]HBV76940.1 hypothetical protein [Vibrio sp.]
MLLNIDFSDIHRARYQHRADPFKLKKLEKVAALLFADNEEILALIHQQTKPFKFQSIAQHKKDNQLVQLVLTKAGYQKYLTTGGMYWWKKNLTQTQIEELLK